jgi:TRAP-type mannitol/chloroaromatic compound transport system substrate-binding protein
MVQRRKFVAGAAAAATVGSAASSFPKPAIAQERIEWRMVTSWPKGLPGLGTGAERLAARIGELSDGRLRVQVFAAGELVPALQCLDAVSSGTADMGHDASYYHIAKSPAFPFYCAVPYGMTAHEINAWIYWGGGQELWDELGDGFGIQAFLAGNTGPQMGGWFRKEINTPADLNGLKFRMPGQGGQVLQKLGATIVNLPGGEIFQNLQSGAIDGTEWVGPYNDLALGFHQVTKLYYWPGFHEPGSALQCMVNKSKFTSLPADLQGIVKAACAEENVNMLAEFNARSGPALQTLIRDHGVQLKQMPREVLVALGRASGELIQEILDTGDDLTKRIAQSFLKNRTEQVAYNRISEWGYTSARLLDFPYPRG